MRRFFALITAVVQFILTFFGSFSSDKTSFIEEKALNSQALCVSFNFDKHTDGDFTGTAGSIIEYTFEKPVTLNTVVLCESTQSVTAFEIQINGETVYRQDKIGAMRYCAIDRVQATDVAILITSANGGFTLDSVGLYNVENSVDKNFRVATYAVCQSLWNPESLDAQHFKTITDVILFGSLVFDENGSLSFEDKLINGDAVDGKTVFETALNNVRATAPNARICVNLLGPSSESAGLSWEESMYEMGELHEKAMKNNRSKFITGILSVLEEYSLDGVYFDYEFPIDKKHWNMYNRFLVALDRRLGEKELGIALASWNNELSFSAFNAVDHIEVMAYDLFDSDGWHAPFYSCAVAELEAFAKKGMYAEKLDLGIPFYSRPTDRAALWIDYKSEFRLLGEFGNLVTEECAHTQTPRYYNGRQMVRDKAAFAADYGASGVMVWHYSCDAASASGASLFDAIGEGLTAR